jgi:dienelactone hydrolase
MPLNLAVFGVDRANAVVAANPQIERWALGGHSLGGAMSAAFIDGNPGVVDGLFFWAAFPADGNDLSDQPALRVASVYGTLDGLATVDEVQASQRLLPAAAAFVPIEGGNHAQFGYYGDQPGDNLATISREEQQTQAVAATAALLETLAE